MKIDKSIPALSREEHMLLLLYLDDTRTETIHNLQLMREELTRSEQELSELSAEVVRKLNQMTDDEFAELDPFAEIYA